MSVGEPAPNLRRVIRKLERREEVSERELSSAISDLRKDFTKVGGELISNRVLFYEIVRMAVERVDEDLFLACEEHDSLRREVYKAVRLMDIKVLEKISSEILAKDLERTLLGSFIMRRISGRGGGT